jgi:hypothetical protein
MLALGFATIGVALWTTWVPLAAGVVVTFLVIGSALIYGRWQRRRLNDASREEDLPWAELLVLLEKRNRDRAAFGLPPEQPTDEVLGELLARLPVADPKPLELPEDHEFIPVLGNERRTGRRRWGNPTEVHVRSALWGDHLHGLVVNRSTGGIGIFADKEVPAGTDVQIRAVEAPTSIPPAKAEVRHCRKVGRGFFFGCEFSDDVPWNVRVWFG